MASAFDYEQSLSGIFSEISLDVKRSPEQARGRGKELGYWDFSVIGALNLFRTQESGFRI